LNTDRIGIGRVKKEISKEQASLTAGDDRTPGPCGWDPWELNRMEL
jgi:hypothetical protein